MWRAFFLGIGVYLMIAGVECLGVERVYWRVQPEKPSVLAPLNPPAAQKKEFPPEPWLPWCLITSGAVVCLYSFTIPKRIAK